MRARILPIYTSNLIYTFKYDDGNILNSYAFALLHFIEFIYIRHAHQRISFSQKALKIKATRALTWYAWNLVFNKRDVINNKILSGNFCSNAFTLKNGTCGITQVRFFT